MDRAARRAAGARRSGHAGADGTGVDAGRAVRARRVRVPVDDHDRGDPRHRAGAPPRHSGPAERRTTRRSCRAGCGRARPSWSPRSARSGRRRRSGPGPAAPQPSEWWLRRMLYELVVHAADAALALGEPVTISSDLAAAGIDEWLEILPFVHDDMLEALPPGRLDAPARARRRRVAAARHARRHGLGTRPRRRPTWRSAATPARSTCLLNRRLPADDPAVEIHGDRPTLDTWLAHTIF